MSRPFNPADTVAQVGRMNLLAISGGRVNTSAARADDGYVDWVEFPVGSGYTVRVTLDWDDTYTVDRVFRRSGKEWVKARWTNVYADEVGEAAYRASSYHHDYEEAEVPA